MVNGQEDWAKILKARVLRKGSYIKYHVFSSIGTGSKSFLSVIEDNSLWMVGNGESIHLWNDNCCRNTLRNLIS